MRAHQKTRTSFRYDRSEVDLQAGRHGLKKSGSDTSGRKGGPVIKKSRREKKRTRKDIKGMREQSRRRSPLIEGSETTTRGDSHLRKKGRVENLSATAEKKGELM